jgi:hypothetical protein
MAREIIKSASGKTLGYRMKTGSRTTMQNASGATIGFFEENANKTFNREGHAVYEGDQTSALLNDESTD